MNKQTLSLSLSLISIWTYIWNIDKKLLLNFEREREVMNMKREHTEKLKLEMEERKRLLAQRTPVKETVIMYGVRQIGKNVHYGTTTSFIDEAKSWVVEGWSELVKITIEPM